MTTAEDKAYREAEERIEEARRSGKTTLDLRGLGLTALPESLCQLTRLRALVLMDNQLTVLPESLGQLTQLQLLILLGNQLTDLPDSLGQLTKLRLLFLTGNHLMALPESLGRLTQLQLLNLSGNKLTALPESLGQLMKLKNLDLSGNRLTALPSSLGQLTKLKNLDLSGNRLTTLPSSLGQLTKLQMLAIRINQLTMLPTSLGQLTQLQQLNLDSNQLTALPTSLGQLTKLKNLDLSSNQLTALPESLVQLAQLRTLDLSGNELTALPEWVGQFTQLKTLDLRVNQLTALPVSLGQLTQLQTLHLRENQLTALPKSLGQLTQLRTLDLSSNQLTALPESLRHLTFLEALYLHDNPALGLPPEILGPTWWELNQDLKPAAPQAILDYYFRPKKPLNEAKLILVGFGKVGKTSLVKRLVDGTFDKAEPKTEGIKITEWPVTPPGIDTVRLRVWDFGGQEIMHSTHQFFLSHRSLYLLVLNGRQGHEDTDAEYWLNLIRSFGGDSPVIVVLNKQREHPFDLNRQHLQSKFPGMIQAFIKTECDDPEQNIEALKQAILHETAKLPGLRDGFPEEWFAIKDKLASMPENYLTFEDYRKICATLGENIPMDQDRLAGYLHQLGIALNYKDDQRLRDVHVLNPRWVTEGIYRILNASALEECKGELHIDDLGKILDSVKYPPARHPFLMNLMRKFHLCFEFPDKEGHYLIPDLADKNQPAGLDEFDPRECLNFQYKYPNLHEGVLPSFITRTYILSENQPRWRTGAILAFEGCRALVKGDLSERLVAISVAGPSPEARRRLLAVIRASFEDIHRHFEFKPAELVPVPGHPEVAILYSELLVLEKNNHRTKQQVIGDSVLELNVLDLLNGVDLEGERKTRDLDRAAKATGSKVFFSYSHKDEALREELETHLKILQRQGLIQGWHDRRIVAGEEWGKEIDRNLEEADIILLLVSADFLASDYCYDIEMTRAMERYEAGEASVIPIILRKCNWGRAPFAKLQALPKNAKPVVYHRSKDNAWTEISKKLEALVKDAQKTTPVRIATILSS